jgi:hypothetical protein
MGGKSTKMGGSASKMGGPVERPAADGGPPKATRELKKFTPVAQKAE